MIRITLLLVYALSGRFIANAQDKYFTKTGKISFYSVAPLEDIEAHHRSVTAILNNKLGTLQFMLLINGFEFEKALMQEDFNEYYLESDKFPKAEFKGQITNNSAITYYKDGEYAAMVKGMLTIHGETKETEATGKIIIKEGKILLNASLNILLSDYKVTIVKLVKDKISNKVKIAVDASLDPLKN
ncbi:MAG: YceI family protein [Chitinophagaceae bacterium]